MSRDDLSSEVQAVRRFSRFYTRRIGVLHEGLLGGPLSLSEGRVIYEIAQAGETSAARLVEGLGLDAGYLSRLLRDLESRGLIGRRASETDGRQTVLSLSEAGRQAFATIDARSHAEVAAMLEPLSEGARSRLVAALVTAESMLDRDATPDARVPTVLRQNRPGDLGWIVHRQAALYAGEYGFDERFEALVAEIVAQFVQRFDARRERCWIAERGGDVVGSVFVIRASDEIAKLRLLYVEPQARGLGIGRLLVDECIRFARRAGYARLTLWTNDVLVAARRIYVAAGFRLVREERHHSFGRDLVGQNWELEL